MKKLLVVILLLIPIIVQSQTPEKIYPIYWKTITGYFELEDVDLNEIITTGISRIDIPVLFFTAHNLKQPFKDILVLRNEGKSWNEIITLYNGNIDMYHFLIMVEFNSPVFTPIFAKFDSMMESSSNSISLSDKEIQDIVNLRIIYRYYDFSVFEVMKLRDKSNDFIKINYDVSIAKSKSLEEEKQKKKEAAKKKAESESTESNE